MKLDELPWEYYSEWWERFDVGSLKIFRCIRSEPDAGFGGPQRVGMYCCVRSRLKGGDTLSETFHDIDPITLQCLVLEELARATDRRG